MDITIVPPSLPFRWQGKDYQITKSGIKNNQAYASVKPDNQELVSELKKRIKKEKALAIYLAHGYVCFVEDYRKIQAANLGKVLNRPRSK